MLNVSVIVTDSGDVRIISPSEFNKYIALVSLFLIVELNHFSIAGFNVIDCWNSRKDSISLPINSLLAILFASSSLPWCHEYIWFASNSAVVFSTTDLTKGWDGTYQGKEQPIDTYIYTLTTEQYNGTKTTEKGTILLLR